jgi:hypothetical protein
MFPSLETQIRIQYKSYRKSPSSHVAHHFVDEGRQSLKLIDSDLKRWVLIYEALQTHESNQLRSFYENETPLSTFSFVDPWTGLQHDRVRFAEGGIRIVQTEPHSFRVECELEQSV